MFVCAIAKSKVQCTIQPYSLDTNSLNFCSFVSDIGYSDVMDEPSFLKVGSNQESVGQLVLMAWLQLQVIFHHLK